jgi:hypothetical protein
MVPEKLKLSQVLEGEGRPAVTVGDRPAERLKRALIISGFQSVARRCWVSPDVPFSCSRIG